MLSTFIKSVRINEQTSTAFLSCWVTRSKGEKPYSRLTTRGKNRGWKTKRNGSTPMGWALCKLIYLGFIYLCIIIDIVVLTCSCGRVEVVPKNCFFVVIKWTEATEKLKVPPMLWNAHSREWIDSLDAVWSIEHLWNACLGMQVRLWRNVLTITVRLLLKRSLGQMSTTRITHTPIPSKPCGAELTACDACTRTLTSRIDPWV